MKIPQPLFKLTNRN